MQRRGQPPVPHRQHGLDQAGHAGGRAEVPDVGLHAADRDGLRSDAAGLPVRRRQRGDLDRVADRGAGAVRLDVADRVGRDPARRPERLGDDGRLARGAGRAETPALGSVSEVRPRCLRVEGPDMAVARVDAVRGPDMALVVRRPHVDGAGQRHRALAAGQRLAGQVHRDQRGGARRGHRHRGPGQAEGEGHPGRDVVGGVVDLDDHVADGGPHLRVVVDVLAVGVRSPAAVDADAAVITSRIVAGVLERGVADLDEDPLLRVGDLRLARVVAEVLGVEALDVVHERHQPHVVRVGDARLRQAVRPEPVGLQLGERLDAVHEVPPELVDVGRAGEPPRHPDDRHAPAGRGGDVLWCAHPYGSLGVWPGVGRSRGWPG